MTSSTSWRIYRGIQDHDIVLDEDNQSIACYETLLLSLSLLDPTEEIPEAEKQIVLETLRVQLGLSNRAHREILKRLTVRISPSKLTPDQVGSSEDPLGGEDEPPFETISYRLFLLSKYAEMTEEKRVFDIFPSDEQYQKFVKRQATLLCQGLVLAAIDSRRDAWPMTLEELMDQIIELFPKFDPLNSEYKQALSQLSTYAALVSCGSLHAEPEPLPYPYPLNSVIYTHLLNTCYEDGSPLYNYDEILVTLRRVRDALFVSPVMESICIAHNLLMCYDTGEIQPLKECASKLDQLTHMLSPQERTHLRLVADTLVEKMLDYHGIFASSPEHVTTLLTALIAAETTLRPDGPQSASAVKIAVGRVISDAITAHIDRICSTSLGKQTGKLSIDDALVVMPIIVDEMSGDVEYFIPHMVQAMDEAASYVCNAYTETVKNNVIDSLGDAGINTDSLSVLQSLRSMADMAKSVNAEADTSVYEVAPAMLKQWDAGLRESCEEMVNRMVDSDDFEQGIVSDTHNHTHSAVDLFAMMSGWISALDTIGSAIWGDGDAVDGDADARHWWFSLSSILCEAVRAYASRVCKCIAPRSELVPSFKVMTRSPSKVGRFKQKQPRPELVENNPDPSQAIIAKIPSNTALCLRVNSLSFVRDELTALSLKIAPKAQEFASRVDALMKDVQDDVRGSMESMLAFIAVKLIHVDLRIPLTELWHPKPLDCRLVEVLHHFDTIMAPVCGHRGEIAPTLSDKLVAQIMLQFIGALEYCLLTLKSKDMYASHVFIFEDDIVTFEEFFVGHDDRGVDQGLDQADVSACLRRIRLILTMMDMDSESLKSMFKEAPATAENGHGLDCLKTIEKGVILRLMGHRDDRVAKMFMKTM